MKKTPLLLTGLGIIIVLILRGVSITKIENAWNHLTEKKVSDIKLNTNTLYISQPVTSMDGKLTAIQGNTITVTHHYVLSDAVGNIASDQKTKDVSIRFTVTPQTKIFRPPTYVPYLFKKQQDTGNQILQPSGLKPGQFVMVLTDGDVQVAQSAPYRATSIQVTRIANNISGTISAVSGATLTVSAPLPPLPASFPPQTPAPAQTYTVRVTPDTELSQREYNEGAPHQLDTSSLVKGAPVAVYADQDVGVERTVTALLITVLDRRPAPSPSVATPAAAISIIPHTNP